MTVRYNLFVAVLLTGCAVLLSDCSAPQAISLNQVPRKRTYPAELNAAFDAVRFFCIREGFRLASADQESGRMIARREISGRAQEDPNVIIMNLHVASEAAGRTTVDAQFSYLHLPASMTRAEETQLAEQYVSLFDLLDSRLK
jgi:hypothetical protein